MEKVTIKEVKLSGREAQVILNYLNSRPRGESNDLAICVENAIQKAFDEQKEKQNDK